MANVNLYSTEQSNQVVNARKASMGSSLMFSLGVVLLTLCIYGGMKIWSAQVDAKTMEVDDQIASVQAELTVTSDESDAVHDTFLRLKHIQEGMGESLILPSLGSVEKNILKGVVLSGYSYEGEKSSNITLDGDATDANALLQQVSRFRDSGEFSNVRLETVGLSDEGFILFTMSMNVVAQNKK